MWEYKSETVKCPSSEIDDVMNDFGKNGWEIFSLYEKDYKSMIGTDITNGKEKIIWYELAMKRSIERQLSENVTFWTVAEWDQKVSDAIQKEWKRNPTHKPSFDVSVYNNNSCLLRINYTGKNQTNVISKESEINEMVKSFFEMFI